MKTRISWAGEVHLESSQFRGSLAKLLPKSVWLVVVFFNFDGGMVFYSLGEVVCCRTRVVLQLLESYHWNLYSCWNNSTILDWTIKLKRSLWVKLPERVTKKTMMRIVWFSKHATRDISFLNHISYTLFLVSSRTRGAVIIGELIVSSGG